MSVFDGGEDSARVARENAAKHNREMDAERNAAWQARQTAARDAERAKQPAWAKQGAPGATATRLAERASLSWRQKQAQARRVAAAKREREAIEAALHPKPTDPRTSAQKLIDGAGQARIDL